MSLPTPRTPRRRLRIAVAAIGAVLLGTIYALAAANAVSAWDDGSGRICTTDGQIIVKDTEQAWQQYLNTHPGSKPYHEGVVCVAPITTTGAPTSTTSPSTTAPSSSTIPPTSAPTPSLVPPVTTPSTDSSPPSTRPATSTPTLAPPPPGSLIPPASGTVPQPGEMCADAIASAPCGTPSSPTATPTTPGSSTNSTTPLPRTGTASGWLLGFGAGLLTAGTALMFATRRRHP